MRGAIVYAVLLALVAVPGSPAGPPDVVLFGGRILTQESDRPTADAMALTGARIRAVGTNAQVRRLAGRETRVIDLRGRTVIPGLIDAHVHLLIANAIVDERSLRAYESTVLPTVLAGFISHGITSIRSTADPLPYVAQLRDRLERADLAGPRLVISGPTPCSPGGHPATTVCAGNSFCRSGLARELTTEEEARQTVRELVRAGVDVVKVTVDNTSPPVDAPVLPDAIVAALVDETHRGGRRIIGHVTDPAAMQRLTEMGIDEFVHLPSIPNGAEASRLAAFLARRKTLVTTTVSYFDAYRDASGTERFVWGAPYTPRFRQILEGNLVAARAFSSAGVRLAVGTDGGGNVDNEAAGLNDPRLRPGARTIHEILVLSRAGLSPADILVAATRNGAEALGILEKVGTIAEGKIADLVVLDGNPLADLRVLQQPAAVLQGGRVVRGRLSAQ